MFVFGPSRHWPDDGLIDQISRGNAGVAVIGLGQVGLPLALVFAHNGIHVTGADINPARVASIAKSLIDSNLRLTTDVAAAARDCRAHIICVPTPLGADMRPDLGPLMAAARSIGAGLKAGDLVVLESTVYPGVTNNTLRPVLEAASGLAAGADFGLAFCAERVDPGDASHRIDNTPRVLGGFDEASTEAAAALYGLVMRAPLHRVSSCEAAEMTKLTENVFRDVNIAFANEIALLCQKFNIDALEVLAAAATKWNFEPHLPGAGVGGGCIPVSPYYLMEAARGVGAELKLVQEARQVNEDMPREVVRLVIDLLAKCGRPISGSHVCLLGLAYKADVAETRGSQAVLIIQELTNLGATLSLYDPFVAGQFASLQVAASLDEGLADADCAVILTEHSAFRQLTPEVLASKRHLKCVVDGRGMLVPREVIAAGLKYAGIGRSLTSRTNIWNSGLKRDPSPEAADVPDR